MLGPHVIATTTQKVLTLLAKFSDREFYERQVARELGIAFGSANRALNALYLTGVLKRRREGKMFFYSIGSSNAAAVEYKKLVNLLLIEPLVEGLRKISSRIVLYGSCAQGTDTSKSDLDLFIVSISRRKAENIVYKFNFPSGFEDIHIQPIIKSPTELLKAGEAEKTFLDEVERGVLLWERAADESGV